MSDGRTTNWEQSVRWYRDQPGHQAAILDNYFDLPVRGAADRYAAGEEFAEVLRLLGEGHGRSVLDLGAGNGIASHALAIHGWSVTAVEPDPSDEVGAGAIRALAREAAHPFCVIEATGEAIPISAATFDAAHCRQVLHHAVDLERMILEVARLLRPRGLMLATREHVADDEAQLAAFRNSHPLHKLYGGEMAYPLERYTEAIRKAGLELLNVWGPFDSILNFYPGTESQRLRALAGQVRGRFGLGRLLEWNPGYRSWRLRRARRRDRSPGRLYSFLARKPCAS